MGEEVQLEINTKKAEKRSFKKEVNKLLRTLLYYETTMFLIPIVCMLIVVFKDNIMGKQLDAFVAKAQENATTTILSIAIGMLFIILYRKKKLFSYDLKTVQHKMKPKSFFRLLVCFMLAQSIFSICSFLMETLFNQFGYTLIGEIESAQSTSNTLSMFLYAAFIGPIAEEIVFRGVVLRTLEKWGKIFAIVVSSIMFGAFHANLIQGLFAIAVGLVLGYVAMEYSIKWSILLHVINNFIFSDGLGYIIDHMPSFWGSVLNYSILVIFFIGGIIILIRSRKALMHYVEENRTAKPFYRYAFTSTWMLVFLMANLLLAISGIEKLAR